MPAILALDGDDKPAGGLLRRKVDGEFAGAAKRDQNRRQQGVPLLEQARLDRALQRVFIVDGNAQRGQQGLLSFRGTWGGGRPARPRIRAECPTGQRLAPTWLGWAEQVQDRALQASRLSF
jgi:hypothetical protein